MGLEGNLCLNMVLLIKGIAEHFRKNEESCCNFKESRTVGFFLFSLQQIVCWLIILIISQSYG